jgi:EpsI family protein
MFDWRFTGVISLLVGTALVSAMSERRPPEALARSLDAIPAQLGNWQATGQETIGAEILNVLKPTSYISRFYQGADAKLGLFVAFYDHQTTGATLHAPKNCLPGTGWQIWKQDRLEIPGVGGNAVINRYYINKANDRLMMYYWYQSKDRIVASEFAGKVFLVRDSLFNGHTAAALVRITMADTAAADRAASDFVSRVIPQLQMCFGK